MGRMTITDVMVSEPDSKLTNSPHWRPVKRTAVGISGFDLVK